MLVCTADRPPELMRGKPSSADALRPALEGLIRSRGMFPHPGFHYRGDVVAPLAAVEDAIVSHVGRHEVLLLGFGQVLRQPQRGLVATGDQFINDQAVLQDLRTALPGLKAVEMEGAAVAQVAEQEGIPWLVLRVISDGADATAAANFQEFIKAYEQRAWQLTEALLKRHNTAPSA